MSLLVWLETEGGLVRRSSLELLDVLREQASAQGLGAVIRARAEDCALLAESVRAHGVSELCVLRLPGHEEGDCPPDLLALALAQAIRDRREKACASEVVTVCAAGTAVGRDLLARLAAELDAPLLQDCLHVDVASGEALKLLFSGRATARYAVPGPLRLFGLRPTASPLAGRKGAVASAGGSAAAAAPVAAVPAAVSVSFFKAPVAASRMRILERLRESSERDLHEAAILVAGGRPVGADGFQLLRQCAAALARQGRGGTAAVAASRSAVDLGYAPPALQVGQTGQVVSPELYLACGISGSVYHTVGIRTAGTVVCVNSDPAAPLFNRADYGLTDDLFTVLPLMLELLTPKQVMPEQVMPEQIMAEQLGD